MQCLQIATRIKGATFPKHEIISVKIIDIRFCAAAKPRSCGAAAMDRIDSSGVKPYKSQYGKHYPFVTCLYSNSYLFEWLVTIVIMVILSDYNSFAWLCGLCLGTWRISEIPIMDGHT